MYSVYLHFLIGINCGLIKARTGLSTLPILARRPVCFTINSSKYLSASVIPDNRRSDRRVFRWSNINGCLLTIMFWLSTSIVPKLSLRPRLERFWLTKVYLVGMVVWYGIGGDWINADGLPIYIAMDRIASLRMDAKYKTRATVKQELCYN